MLTLEEPYPHKTAFLQLGFRPFFAAGLGFGAISMFLWMLLYLNGWTLPNKEYASMTWHAHEMIFGFAMAVVAGFLLTAIRNWTNIQTIRRTPLLLLALVWLAARIAPFTGLDSSLLWAAIFDLLFGFALFIAALHPVVKSKQWKQMGIVSKLLLMLLANLAFYLGLFGIIEDGGHAGLYSGLYLILALVLTMARRMIPFFVEKAVGAPFQARNYRWIDISSLILFLAFAISDIIDPFSQLTAILGLLQFLLHSIRLKLWHHADIWKKPLLWVLYLAYVWLTLGFLLKAGSIWFGLSPYAAIHSFAYGGIGMITLGMMARVTLGHTGRNVFDPPKQLNTIFLLIAVGTIFRVIVPLLLPSWYTYWIATAQILWIAGFTYIFVIYLPMLIKARVDGRPG